MSRRSFSRRCYTTIYHTPFDEPSRIEYPKLTRMAKWMYATGWAVSETRERPAINPGYKFSR